MDKQEKENWIEQTLRSLDGIQPAELPAGFVDQVLQRRMQQTSKALLLSGNRFWVIAAAVILWVVVNIGVCIYAQRKQSPIQEAFATESFPFAQVTQF